MTTAILSILTYADLPIGKTRQTTVYRTGDDGYYTKGQERNYIDNGNGTVTDTMLNLIWQNNYRDNKGYANNGTVPDLNYTTGGDYCSDIDLAGLSNWRLPSKRELASLIDYSRVYPDTFIDPVFRTSTRDNGIYWTSTIYAPNMTKAWFVRFAGNGVNRYPQSDTYNIRCVSSGTSNTPPTANAGVDQSIETGTDATLDGSGSSDADAGDNLTYSWSFTSRPAGSTATLTNANTVNPTFTSDMAGEYVIELIVNDGTVDSTPDSVTVTTGGTTPPANTPPTADAGLDKTVQVNHVVTLSGSGSSDSDGTIVAYKWVKQSTGDLLSTSETFNFTPTGTKTKTFVLTVTDNDGATASDTMVLTVTKYPVGNIPPTANAGVDQSIETGTDATLDGSGSSDADAGDNLTYSWSFTSRPAGSTATLTNANTVNPTFTSDMAGEYVIELIVNDGTVDSTPDSVTVTTGGTTPPANTPPTADAGLDKTVQVNHVVTLSGSGSSDSDGTIVAYKWVKQSTGDLLSTSETFNFTPTGTKTKTFVLTVTDNDGATASDTMVLTVTRN